MKKEMVFLLLAAFIGSLACRALTPATARDGTVITNCPDVVTAVRNLQPAEVPDALLTGVKQGGEFDVNDYFTTLTHLSMQEGYILDYVYQSDGLGAYPILYARPVDQPAYVSVTDLPAGYDWTEYRSHVMVAGAEQGFFEFAVMNIMAGQFYLYWHANYNDTEIVCDNDAANAIVENTNSQGFGMEFDLLQQAQVRKLTDVEPVVRFTDDSAIVEMVVFTKWGGFHRWTYTISRSFPHQFLDVQTENLVPYDCGILF